MRNDPGMPPTGGVKTYPFCRTSDVPSAATRCPHCAGDIGHHELLHSKVCFVATAATGDVNHADVVTLRAFRDAMLLPNRPGRIAVRVYYQAGPYLARAIHKFDLLRRCVRVVVVRPLAIVARRAIRSG